MQKINTMKLHEKVRYYREAQGISQEFAAHKMGITQSQYSRRESGNIKFNTDEVILLSNILKVEPSVLFNEETIIFNNTDQKGGNFGQYIALPEELIKQYEARLKEKDELIQLLREKIHFLESRK